MKRATVAALVLAGASLVGMGLSGARRENPEAVALLTEIVELRRAQADSLRVQMRLLENREPERLVGVGTAVQDWCDARVRLARERSDRHAERTAIQESLAILRELREEGESRPFDMNEATLGLLHIPVLEAELQLLRLKE